MSSQIICQSTNTNPIKCFPEAQVTEIFKGLKQGEFLRQKLSKTEEALENAASVIAEQKIIVSKLTDLNNKKDVIIENDKFIAEQRKKACDEEILSLQTDLKILEKQSKANARKKFWNGIKYGAGGTVLIGGIVAGLLIFN